MSFEEWLQSRLTAHGYPVGAIDGNIGPTTVAAIKAFEKAHGLPEDGKADEKVVALLRQSATAEATKANPMPERDEEADELLYPPTEKSATWPRQKDVPAFYGKVGENQTQLVLPFPMRLAWDKSQKVTKITLHKKVHDSAGRAFDRIAKQYSVNELAEHGLDLFGGSLNVRKMRGGSQYSMHSWGIAIDFDPERNQLKWDKARAYIAKECCASFCQAWADEGWLGLGPARNYDWMHFQAARL